jgi:hypothetical protein
MVASLQQAHLESTALYKFRSYVGPSFSWSTNSAVRHEALELHADERSAVGHRSGRQKLRAG